MVEQKGCILVPAIEKTNLYMVPVSAKIVNINS